MKDKEIKKGAGYLEELAGRLLQERIHDDDAVPDMNNMTEKQIIDYARQYDRRYYLSHRNLAQAERVDPYYRRHPELHRRLRLQYHHDLARLDPKLPLLASGFAGHGAEGGFILSELAKYPNIDLGMVRRDGRTSFTAVMSNNQTKERTFFQYAGANAYYAEEHIGWEKLDVSILHVGYILLLPSLDAPDAEYGTKMARLLHRAQEKGIKTSIDVVSEAEDRFARLVMPALQYAGYCVINELEAQQTTGVALRNEDGRAYEKGSSSVFATLQNESKTCPWKATTK